MTLLSQDPVTLVKRAQDDYPPNLFSSLLSFYRGWAFSREILRQLTLLQPSRKKKLVKIAGPHIFKYFTRGIHLAPRKSSGVFA
ncbi:unnamed protein product [Ixodes pacificus]